MLFLKLAAPLVVLLGVLLNYFFDKNKKSDNTEIKNFPRNIFVCIIGLGSIAAGIVIVSEHNSSIIAQEKIENLNEYLDEAASDRDTLLNNFRSLQSSLAPFLRAAEIRYPDLDSTNALINLAKDLNILQMRVDTLNEGYLADKREGLAKDRLKHTPPQVEARWAISTDGRHVVEIKSLNLVPFEARWYLVNQSGTLLGVLMMGNAEFFPTEDRIRWLDVEMIDSTKLVDNYVKFYFEYWSIYFDEMGAPDSLKSEIVREYRLVDNVPRPW